MDVVSVNLSFRYRLGTVLPNRVVDLHSSKVDGPPCVASRPLQRVNIASTRPLEPLPSLQRIPRSLEKVPIAIFDLVVQVPGTGSLVNSPLNRLVFGPDLPSPAQGIGVAARK